MALEDIPDARPLRPDWFVTRPLLTGICGSDSKQILLDFGDGDSDNAMSGLCSFPQVMGHEVVAEVTELGPEAEGFDVGQRVVLNPWLSCAPRGISPALPRVRGGRPQPVLELRGRRHQHRHPHRRVERRHRRLRRADAGALHDALRGPRRHRRRARHLRRPVLGVAAQHHPPPAAPGRSGARVGRRLPRLVRGRDPPQRSTPTSRSAWWRASTRRPTWPRKLGAHRVFRLGTQQEMVEELAEWSGGVLRPTMEGLPGVPMCHPGGIDVAYDTVGKPETFEVEVRVLKARGTLVKSGVHAPGRWEWSPLYFKEISWVGSNAFGIEEVEGVRQHAIQHYLDLVQDGRIDLTGLLTHTFALTDWQDAFATIADQGRTRRHQGRHRPATLGANAMGTLAFVCAMPMEMRPLAKRLDLEKGEVGGRRGAHRHPRRRARRRLRHRHGPGPGHRRASTGCSPPCTPSASSCSASPARWRTRRRSAP